MGGPDRFYYQGTWLFDQGSSESNLKSGPRSHAPPCWGQANPVTIGQHFVEIRNAAVDERNLNILTSNAYPLTPPLIARTYRGAGIVVTCVEVH
jgi:hypothetical protein